jgi:hypothetical protein
MNVGKWYTKNGGYVDDIRGPQAAFMAITGLTPERFSRMYLELDSMQSFKEAKDAAKKEIVKLLRQGNEAKEVADKDRYFQAAKALRIAGGFMPDEYAQIMKEAFMNGPMVGSVDRAFVEKAPPDEREARHQMYLKRKEQEGQ